MKRAIISGTALALMTLGTAFMVTAAYRAGEQEGYQRGFDFGVEISGNRIDTEADTPLSRYGNYCRELVEEERKKCAL